MCRAIHDHCPVLDRLFPSLRSFVRAFALASPGGDVFESGSATAGIVPALADRSVVNSVVSDELGEDLLDELAAAYDAAGVRAWTVWVPEHADAVQRLLEAAGHVLDAEPMAMAMALDGLEPPADGELELVPDPEPAAVAEVLEPAYGWEGAAGALRWYDGSHPYLALADGRPACTLGVHDHEGDAHVVWVGTVEAARGRGLASRLMRRALADARERGCTTTTLVATRMGHPVYSRLGYEDLGRVQMWERRKPPA